MIDTNRVLVVAAHPDDEVLGCGGTIARHADAGDHVQLLIVSEGATSRQQQRDRLQAREELSVLAKAAQAAGSILGAAGVDLLDLQLDERRADEIHGILLGVLPPLASCGGELVDDARLGSTQQRPRPRLAQR